MESHEQRDIRRAVSGWITEQENNFSISENKRQRLFGVLQDGLGTAVRALTIESLQTLNQRLKQVNESLQGDKYHVKKGKELVKFYMKGGNAFNCIIDSEGEGATELGGGNSDWDTQIVIDPWAPLPLMDIIYSLVEDIVLDEFSSLGIKIATEVENYTTSYASQNPPLGYQESVVKSWEENRMNINNGDFSRYDLKLDSPQTVRKICDHERIGLWMNSRTQLSSTTIKQPEWIPGISFNDSIKPFALYRLGYTWHLEEVTNVANNVNQNKDKTQYAGEIKKPALMEIIDVTIPRKNTIESVRVWEELIHDEIEISNLNVAVVKRQPKRDSTVTAQLPLPDVFYHASELATMLCEIPDGSSRHTDKMIKRFSRLKQIANIKPDTNAGRVKKKMSDMVGVVDIEDSSFKVDPDQKITNLIEKTTDPDQRKYLGLVKGEKPDPIYALALKMMNYVSAQTVLQNKKFDLEGRIKPEAIKEAYLQRNRIKEEIATLISKKVIPAGLDFGYSDDLAVLDFLLENGYINISKIGFSGVTKSITMRALDYDMMKLLTAKIISDIESKSKEISTKHKLYNTPRSTRISYETLIIVFNKGKADMFLTITTASAAESPFIRDPVSGAAHYAPILDIGNQRKVAAAMLDDYIIGTAMSRQLEAIKETVNM